MYKRIICFFIFILFLKKILQKASIKICSIKIQKKQMHYFFKVNIPEPR